jgi:hypothetical protein
MNTIKPETRGGKRPGAGRVKGSTNKISGEKILNAVKKQCGKPFEQLLAEGYHATILACDISARQQYEKMILAKVVADKHSIDHTTLGQSLHASFSFPQRELSDWQTQQPLPITYKIDG